TARPRRRGARRVGRARGEAPAVPPPRRAARAREGAARARQARGPARPARRSRASSELVLEELGEPRQAGAGARLHGAERNVEKPGDLALRKPAPVRELDDLALVLGQILDGPM